MHVPQELKRIARKLKKQANFCPSSKWGSCEMQALSIVLLLISVGTILGPIGAVVIIYHNDLSQLVIPPQIRDIMNGNSNLIPHGNSNGNGNSGLGGLLTPVFVSAQSNKATHTFTGIFNVTNTLNFDLTLNSFSTDVEFTQANIPAASLSLSSPVTVLAGQTAQLTISGHWTQEAQDYMTNNFPGITSVDLSVSNVEININGITIQSAGPIQIGNIPMNAVS
jgi:hypothetical protein